MDEAAVDKRASPDAPREPAGISSLRRGLLELEFPGTRDFDDPADEWRRLFAELLGTFLVVVAATGGTVVAALSDGAVDRVAQVFASGLTVAAVILFLGEISGAHLNPAVSIGFALRGLFPWRRLPGYVIAQCVGASLASLFMALVLGSQGALGATEPGAGIHAWQALLVEVVIATGLVSTVLGTASNAQNIGPLSALGIGGYIVACGLWSSPVSGASMNPARSFGPDVVRLNFSNYWIYVIGPVTGALVAVLIASVLQGRVDGRAALDAAQGTISESDAKEEVEQVMGEIAAP
jgi:aquaporin Z